MIKDIFTIVRKDLKEMFTSRGNVKSGAMYLLIVIGVMGIFMPLQSGREWLTKPLIPLVWSWFPILLVISVVTNSFAGERERNTLETLLASRLSDKAILFGKITASVLYGWGIGLISNLVAVITVNITDPGTGFQFYDPMVLLLIVLNSPLIGYSYEQHWCIGIFECTNCQGCLPAFKSGYVSSSIFTDDPGKFWWREIKAIL